MTSVIVRKNEIDLVSRETYTAGSVNVYTVKAKLSAEWKALSATPVFRAGSVRISTVFDEFGCCVIPHEVLEHAGQMLEFGVYGVNESGAELPTIWAKLDYIREGTSPGENAQEPTPSLYDQLVGQVGDAVNDARGYAQSAAAAKDAAENAERGAELSAGYAADNAEDAEAAALAAAKSETAAGTAAKDAQTAAEAAVKAAQGAASDKAAADTAARNAAEAKTATAESANAAETAKTGAETAKTGAETAKTAAETARDAAQRYAGDAQEALSGAQGIAAGKLDKPGNTPEAGKILKVLSVNEDGTFVCEWSDAPSGGVSDVRVAGESIVSDGVADVPLAGVNKVGVVAASGNYGIQVGGSGQLTLIDASTNQISSRAASPRRAINIGNLDYAVRAAMCDGKGAAWTADEQAAARERMGLDNWELLADITLEEEVVGITFQNSKKIKELSIFGTIYASSDAFSGNVGIYCGTRLIHSLNTLPSSGAKYFNADTRYVGGFYYGQVSTFDINSYSVNQATAYTYLGELQDIASEDLRLVQLNSKKIGIGTSFKIWIREA